MMISSLAPFLEGNLSSLQEKGSVACDSALQAYWQTVPNIMHGSITLYGKASCYVCVIRVGSHEAHHETIVTSR
jgi:hypothetical protein